MRANVYIVNEDTYGFSKSCMHCGEESHFTLTYDEYVRLIVNNEYIQDVFPHLSKEDREVMISGTHPKCWNEMFPIIEDDEYDDIDYSQYSDEELGFDEE